MYKKFISFFVSFTLVICMITIPASAGETNSSPQINNSNLSKVTSKKTLPKTDSKTSKNLRVQSILNSYAMAQSFNGDPYEPNDSMNIAYTVSIGGTYESYINSNYDCDFYKLKIDSAVNLHITLSNLPYRMNLYDSNGKEIAYSIYDPDTQRSEIDYSFSKLGTYYIEVSSFYLYSKTQKYSLNISKQNELNDIYEPNDTIDEAYPVNLEESIDSYIESNSDIDIYRFNISSPGIMNISLSNLPYEYGMTLVDSYGYSLVYSDSAAIDYRFDSEGTYYIIIDSSTGQYSRTQKYSFKISPEDKLADPLESDSLVPVNIGQTYEAYLETSNDWDEYSFSLTSPSNVKITLSNLPDYCYMYLYNSNYESITYSTYDEENNQSIIDYDLGSGNYIVGVGGYSRTQKYSLNISLLANLVDPYEPNDTMFGAYPISIGQTYKSYISHTNDEDYYLLNDVNPGSLDIVLSNMPCASYLELLDSNGECLAGSYGPTDSETINYNFSEAGYYYIHVLPSEDYGDGYSRTQEYSLIVTPPAPEIVNVSGVSLDQLSADLVIGDTLGLNAAVYPDDALNKNVTWTSSNTSVATVDSTGKVTAISDGCAIITVKSADGGYAARCAVTVKVNMESINNFVTRLYQLCLGRTPDEGGLNYWAYGIANKTFTGADAVYNFIFSPEFIQKNVSDSDFIDIMYQLFFNRPADDGGKAYWAGKLAAGDTRLYVLSCFTNSDEFTAVCSQAGIKRGTITLTNPADLNPQITEFVYRLYNLCLNRKPDDSGLNYYVGQLASGNMSGTSVAYGFVCSSEFTSRNLSYSDFVTILYRVLLNREPDESGLTYYVGRLKSGTSRIDIFNSFANSAEFAGICNTYGIKVK